MLSLVSMDSQESNVYISVQSYIQSHIGSVKSAMVGVCIPQSPIKAINEGGLPLAGKRGGC